VAAIPVAIFGICGRMGQSLIQALAEQPASLTLTGAIASAGSARLGSDAAAGVKVTADVAAGLRGAKVAMDFSQPGALLAHARACAAARVALLVGVTGFDAAARAELQSLSAQVPLLLAPNTSVGVAVVNELAALAAKTLGVAWDVQIAEAHHAGKRDAPSGTALLLGEAAAEGRKIALDQNSARGRDGITGARKAGDIGFASLRGGTVTGEHSVIFAGAMERIELTHKAEDRTMFAQGAVKAALWAHGKQPGFYSMADVLGLGDF